MYRERNNFFCSKIFLSSSWKKIGGCRWIGDIPRWIEIEFQFINLKKTRMVYGNVLHWKRGMKFTRVSRPKFCENTTKVLRDLSKFKKFVPRIYSKSSHTFPSIQGTTNQPILLIDKPDVSHQRKRSKSSPNRPISTRGSQRETLARNSAVNREKSVVRKLFTKPSLDPFVGPAS